MSDMEPGMCTIFFLAVHYFIAKWTWKNPDVCSEKTLDRVINKASYRKQIARHHSSQKFWPGQKHGRPCKIFLLFSITIQDLVAVSYTVGPKNLVDAGTDTL